MRRSSAADANGIVYVGGAPKCGFGRPCDGVGLQDAGSTITTASPSGAKAGVETVVGFPFGPAHNIFAA